MTEMARLVLAVKATTVPAESLFSVVGIIQDEQRNRLEPALLGDMALVKNSL